MYINLTRCHDDTIIFSYRPRKEGKRTTRLSLSPEQALHLSNRLQSFAKSGGYAFEVIYDE